MLRIGEWCVDPMSSQISKDGQTKRLDERSMRLLLCLADRPGEVVSIEDLLNQGWPGVIVSPDSVYQAIASLRRQLGDDSKQPTYIATVPRLGYRIVAAVNASADQSAEAQPPKPSLDRRAAVKWAAVTAVGMSLMAAFLVHGKIASHRPSTVSATARPEKSIAVLPFLDLTDNMSHEIFADSMTEELIDKFSKIQGLRVAAPRSSFLLKGKKMAISEVGKTLGVTYALDGSIRKSGARLRVAARLIRAENGYILWSQTYDRRWDDLLTVQDDIAGEVASALRASIEAQ